MKNKLAMIRFALFLSLISASTASILYGQGTDPSLLTTAGGLDHTDRLQLSWSVGEIAVGEGTTRQGYVTEGYHQPMLTVTAIEQPQSVNSKKKKDLPDCNVTISPNPFTSSVLIHFSPPLDRMLHLMVFDVNGNLVTGKQLEIGITEISVDCSGYAAGQYVLRFQDEEGKTAPAFLISKIQ